MKKLVMLVVVLMLGCLAGVAVASDASRIKVPAEATKYVYAGEHAVIIFEASAPIPIPENVREFATAGGYLVTKAPRYQEFYDATVSVKKFNEPRTQEPLKPSPGKPAVYIRVPRQPNGEPFANYAPLFWWHTDARKGMNTEGRMYYVDAETGDLLPQPLRRDGQIFTRPGVHMNLKDRQLDCKFNPRAALDFVQLAPPGIDARIKVIDEDTVEVTPSFPVKIESGWLNFVKIERLDSLFGDAMEITDGEITADKKYRFTNLF